MNQITADVVIIGAGAAGLMAALELVLSGKKVAVIEAQNRTGGRMHTITDAGFDKPVELGAEFVHGNLPLTLQLFEKAGIKKCKTGGDVWQSKNGTLSKQRDFISDYDALIEKFKGLKEDISVAAFMQQYLPGDEFKELRFTLKNYVQGYYAGSIEDASTLALCEELTNGEEVAYRVEGGYKKLVHYLENECRSKGVTFFLEEVVQEIGWTSSAVEVITNKQKHSAVNVLITVPIGVLQSDAIRFSPALPQKLAAIKKLGFGHVLKLNLQFSEAFWKDEAFTKDNDLSSLNFLFSVQTIPTWWTQHPHKEALLVGWLGGPPALAFTNSTDDEIEQTSINSLAAIFSVEPHLLQQKLKGFSWYNWSASDYFRGAYSYNVVNGKALIDEVLSPVEQTIYFAGEGLHYGNEMGTVEAALVSGRNVARQLIATFS